MEDEGFQSKSRDIISAIDSLIIKHEKLHDEEKKFTQEIASTLHESIAASSKNLDDSLTNLIEESTSLGKKLHDDITTYITKFESSRLRAFGRYRINLDSIMRGAKEDVIRDLRAKLGFTPTGEAIFRDMPEVPSMPSAVYIAESMRSTKDLIKRGFIEVGNRAGELVDEKKEEYLQSIGDVLKKSENETLNFVQEKESLLSDKNRLFTSLINQYKSKFELQKETSSLIFDNLISNLNDIISKENSELEVSNKQILSDHLTKENTILTDSIGKISAFSEEIGSIFQSTKSDAEENKIIQISGTIASSLRSFNENGKNYHSLLKNDSKLRDTFIKKSDKNLKEFGDILQKLQKELSKTKKITFEHTPEIAQSFDEISVLITKLGLVQNEMTNTQTIHKNKLNSHLKDSEKHLSSQAKLLSNIEKKEVEIDQLLKRLLNSQMDGFYQKIQISLENLIRDIGLQLSQNSSIYAGSLEKLQSKSILRFNQALDDFKTQINDKISLEQEQWIVQYNAFENDFHKFDSSIKVQIDDVTENVKDFYQSIHANISQESERLISTIEVNSAQLKTKLNELFDNLSVSIINLINNLESKLGDEYESLLDYFEKTKETSLGTAKLLLDELGATLSRIVDTIWTTVLKELNTLQESTNSTNLSNRSKNEIRDTNAKMAKVIENRLKGVNEVIDLLNSSLKIAFDELNSQISDNTASLNSKIKDLLYKVDTH